MNKTTSFYLDLLRVIAAFSVLLVHVNMAEFSNNLFIPSESGHKFVMIFFVLSGYLIAFTVHQKNKGSQRYLIDRFSRLYSVVMPALLFTFVLDYVGKHFNPGFYADKFKSDHLGFRYLMNFTYLGQVWGFCTIPGTNGPFWSLPYEFWYYMIFWAGIYLKGYKRVISIIVISCLVGVKILILLPVWLFGVLAYHISQRMNFSNKLLLFLFGITALIIGMLTFYWDFSFFSNQFPFGRPPLFFSSHFVFDWIYGALVAINIGCIGAVSSTIKIPIVIERCIKYLSSITFSLYLYHLPILVFIAAFVPYNKSSYLQVTVILIGLIVIVGILSAITEKRRKYLSSVIEKIFSIFRKTMDIKYRLK